MIICRPVLKNRYKTSLDPLKLELKLTDSKTQQMLITAIANQSCYEINQL